MDLNSRTALELHFAEQFETVLFPVLANHYFIIDDYVRARKVCEIGLEHHPENVDGLFVLGKAQQSLKDYVNAEKSLKAVLTNGTVHLQAALALVDVQIKLKRAESSILKTWELILKWDPGNKKAQEYTVPTPMQKTAAPSPKKQVKTKEAKRELDTIDISPRLATFTMVAVLRNQGLHFQALQVLDVLEKKGGDIQRITTERKSIQDSLEI
ncbi:MAG: tetratricopeptide repeat protein [Fidelibacterota bacterium]